MIRLKNLDNKNFQSRYEEAISQLPLYTQDWTNYNVSDPGITTLENFTILSNIQLGTIGRIDDAVRFALLKMCGFTAQRGRCARLLLMGKNLKEEVILPANKQLKLGTMCFETERITKVYPYKFTDAYGFYEDQFHNLKRLLELDIDIPTPIFGDNPQEGDGVYFLSDGMPMPGENLIVRVDVADRYNRNPFREKDNNLFASIEWQVYTENGFETVHVKDGSAAFLMNGEIRIKMPETPCAVYSDTPNSGYCLRAVIKNCSYDVSPKVINAVGFLFEVFQKQTHSSGITSQKTNRIRVFNDMAQEGYVRVFVKEKKGTSYHMYEPSYFSESHGRYYYLKEEGPGMFEVQFSKDDFGYEPAKVKNPVKVLVYDEFIMQRFSIGTVRGYDNENIKLPVGNILPNTFSIMARRKDEEGNYIYDFARPGREEEGALCYELFEKDGRIVIKNPGDYIGADLFIGTITTYRGEEGNIRPRNTFKIDEGEFYNPGSGEQGRHRETLEELHMRFLQDINRPYTAVTEGDYETLVKEIPQLCIRKVRAYADARQNLVRVAVMPGTDEKFPMLSDLYKRVIAEYLEERRLLTTRIEIVQPVYIPVNIVGTIYIKKHYGDARQDIEEAIRYQLDYINNNKNLGETLSFNQVFHTIEALNCVEYIYDLSMKPTGLGHMAYVKDSDIHIRENVLLYPGEINLDIGAYNTSN